MSKQTNEQDEQKSPSGEAQDGSRREAGATGKSGGAVDKNRAKKRGKSSQPEAGGDKPATAPPDRSASASAPASTGEAAAPSPETPPAKPAVSEDGKATPAAASDKPAPGGSATGTDKPRPDAKPSGAKPDGKGEDKASAGKTSDKPAGARPASASTGAGQVPPGASNTTGGRNGGGKGTLALVLVLFLGIGAGLFAWKAWERMDSQQQRLAELEERAGTAASADQFAELESRVESRLEASESESADAVESIRSEFASYRSEVDSALDHVLDELSREQEPDEREWLHAEAAYLLRLANQRLQLERDVEGAAALLRTADDRLNEADNPALLSIRRAIASELSVLESVPQVDRTGLYMALNAQQERLAELPLSRELEEIPARSGMQEAPAGGWQEQLSRFGQELKDLVVIRHHDEALETLVTPEQESYLRQSARLILEQAQLALLQEEQALYEASIDKALALLDAYYDTERSEVQAVIERLETLKGETIRPELPDISGSQQALAQFIERRFGSRGERGDDA
ncbi:uroporphyrinogen-III C-methyltransferase [Halomonas sp. ANAO-440]|uniref:uroporphyrinogen-III C-methyltransferase n=1 Tax=Halomonas sp. ANAO-440 TaxID=2861360 RepID=UPI001CAA7B07|nr:uroporphyrinogen-III C-methyltransferase [Halomonas sp. ANAO-440]MBZ0332376.1 uroporphyrinogen-III C-methyltransferase [Halomonas sp. ANAO-440]